MADNSDRPADNCEYIDGRSYNNDEDVQYLFPNDVDEATRLHQQHWIIRYAFQSNFHAPVKSKLEEGINVLDSGCGPASWTADMAESYPNSTFTGLDISFVESQQVKTSNLTLVSGNITKDVPFPENTFDYFHQRLLIFGLTKEDWTKALKNAYNILKPGGYIELVEPNIQYYNMGPLLENMQQTMEDMALRRGMISDAGSLLTEMLSASGFENIESLVRPVPINHTNKIGELFWQDVVHTYTNLRPMMVLSNPAFEDPEVYQEHLDAVGRECAEGKPNLIFNIAYAQKPLEE